MPLGFIDFSASIEGPEPSKLVARVKRELIKSLGIFGKRASGKGKFGLAAHLQRGKFAENSEVWKMGGKGGRRVFYDTGAFRNLPSFMVIPSFGDVLGAVRVGIIDNSAHVGHGSSISNQALAKSLVQGFSFEPNPRQAVAFWSQIDKRKIQSIDAKFAEGNQWVSPPRDFTKHLHSPEVHKLFIHYVDQAQARAFKKKRKITI